MSTGRTIRGRGVLLGNILQSVKSRFKAAVPTYTAAPGLNTRSQIAAGAAEEGKMRDHQKGSDGDCLKAFEAAYENLKARVQDELDKLKIDIRKMHKKVRTEVITGDPQKADSMSSAAVHWMNGVQVSFKETIERPDVDVGEHEQRKSRC